MKIRQHLWFRQDMDAALEFYTSLIPGSSIGWISNILTSNPNGPAGSARVAGFTLANRPYMGFEAGPFDHFDHNSQIMIECETQAEADRLRRALGKPGASTSCNPVRDAWGVSWLLLVGKKVGSIDTPLQTDIVGADPIRGDRSVA